MRDKGLIGGLSGPMGLHTVCRAYTGVSENRGP